MRRYLYSLQYLDHPDCYCFFFMVVLAFMVAVVFTTDLLIMSIVVILYGCCGHHGGGCFRCCGDRVSCNSRSDENFISKKKI